MDRGSSRSAVGLVVASALLGGLTACTTGTTPRAAPSPSATTTGPPSVQLRTRVGHVAGRLPAASRSRLVAEVGRTLSTYLEGAFLGGTYPRSDFDGSFDAFTAGAATSARRDEGLLTNRRLGPSTDHVRATRRTASLSVLAPGGTAAGVTAAVDVVLRVDRGARPARRVHLHGRLLLTPRADGSWAIFGYDLARSTTPAGGAS